MTGGKEGKPCTARRRLHPALCGRDGHGRPGRQGKERNGQAQRLSLKRWYETVTISKQLDSDRRAAYVPGRNRLVEVRVSLRVHDETKVQSDTTVCDTEPEAGP